MPIYEFILCISFRLQELHFKVDLDVMTIDSLHMFRWLLLLVQLNMKIYLSKWRNCSQSCHLILPRFLSWLQKSQLFLLVLRWAYLFWCLMLWPSPISICFWDIPLLFRRLLGTWQFLQIRESAPYVLASWMYQQKEQTPSPVSYKNWVSRPSTALICSCKFEAFPFFHKILLLFYNFLHSKTFRYLALFSW